jgi:hypothetical protein
LLDAIFEKHFFPINSYFSAFACDCEKYFFEEKNFAIYKCKIQHLPNAVIPNLRRCASLSRLSSTAGGAAAGKVRLLCLVFETAAAGAGAAAGLDFGGNFDFEALLVAIFNVVTSFFFVLMIM